MSEMTPRRASRRYNLVFWPAMALYVVACFIVPHLIESQGLEGAALYAVAIVPAIPIGVVLFVLGRWLRETDEFIRARQVTAMIIGWAITSFFTVGWGFLETFAGAPDFPLFLVMPLFFGTYGLALLVIYAAGALSGRVR